MALTIPISPERYLELLEAEAELNALKAYGVDNWGGYGEALSSLEDPDDETEEAE